METGKLRGKYKCEMIHCLTAEKLTAGFQRSDIPHFDSGFLRDRKTRKFIPRENNSRLYSQS
jgi:hypothetical protein